MQTVIATETVPQLPQSFVESYKNFPVPWGPLGQVTYKRTYSRPIVPPAFQHIDSYHEQLKQYRNAVKDPDAQFPTEDWWQTSARCVNWYLRAAKGAVSVDEGMALYDDMMNLRSCFSGRALWQCGTATVDRLGMASLCNCYFVNVDSITAFLFTFDMLMLGGGVGFNIQKEFVFAIPKVQQGRVTRRDTADADFIVPDSREGWIELLRRVFDVYFTNKGSLSYSTICIRPAGSPISGFGGVASGPGPLCSGIADICKVLDRRVGKKLRPIDCLDIMNIIGSIVVAGNVRRSAELALGDHEDTYFLEAKRFDLKEPVPNWRAMSNNSIACSKFEHIPQKFWATYESGGEPYGLVNLNLSRKTGRTNDRHRKDPNASGTNPCMPSWATVLTPDGIRTIGQIKIGDIIWSGSRWTKVTNKWSTGIKPVYEYHTRAGVFIGTDNHRVVSKREKIEVGAAETIDTVTGPALSCLEQIPQAVMDGLVLGDGSVHKASGNLVHLYIGDNDQDYFKDTSVSTYIKKHRPGIKDKAYEIETTIVAEELPLTYQRSVPSRYKSAKPDVVCSFLRGLYSANGSICGNRVTLKATSLPLILDVQQMLSSVGIRSYYTVNRAAEVEHANGIYTSKQSYDLNISVDRGIFEAKIGFIQKYKNDKLAAMVEESDSCTNTKYSYEIVDIQAVGEHEVFDITVDADEHTFWSGGLLVSNCGEVTLEHGESCNLAEIFVPNIRDDEEFRQVAGRIWKVCKVIASLPHHWDFADKVISRNMRTGLGCTGVLQAPYMTEKNYSDTYEYLRGLDKEFSAQLGAVLGRTIPESIKLTTVKPSGTLSLLAGTSPGIHPEYAPFYIRRIRVASNSFIVTAARQAGYTVEPVIRFDGTKDLSTSVVEFPVKARPESVVAADMTAIDQLEVTRRMQRAWSDNSVSVTVYFRKEELPAIKKWLSEHYDDEIKTVSFLLHSEHGFIQAPYEEITEKEFERRTKHLRPLDLRNGFETLEDLSDCGTGACPVR